MSATGAPLIVSGILGVGEIAVGAYQHHHANKIAWKPQHSRGGLGLLAAVGATTGQLENAFPAAVLGGVAVGVNLINQTHQQRQQSA
ncbi:hypothetical protein MMAN_58290 [Mycobacterium mantenii]|uniref:Uncharacterized protein n=1 Tax=Mycobacterium mantenii TaxID=560555 RepID=A0A1X0G3Y8_MYCNT|nr:hypothetical protein [Mycobacterium mantenii]MCV7243847.1 hypothetical protein [Mycobacterium mantenii]ORB08704.1 hypothetical protein BST30_01825 [Mycobacterium mantenii]BBY35909.1 hypothetical protein MMAN_00430 [Mycobacterium mantenii]BBY41695.1 hypothetical protein MMAN_58290 [Mycobacterium mantenii]